ncbi:MAG TPA: T9SS type A sorting domain-containing protein [Chitinophagaceae bacterium]|nr:T9SS type A sorting domain-containing protein [Chitinophagaceae bacterium]
MRQLLIVPLLLLSYRSLSQNCLSANAGPDKILCTPNSTTIGNNDADNSLFTYLWAPSAGLNSTTVMQPTATPSMSTIYTLTKTARNLIVNGDFELGTGGLNTFQSDYTYHTTVAHGRFGLTTDPHVTYSPWCQTSDHTPGTGNTMMWVDGSETVTNRVWAQTVNIVAGKTYRFTGWVYSVGPPYVEPGSCISQSCGDAIMLVTINGQAVVNNQQIAYQNCGANSWVQITGTWTAGASETSAIVNIYSTSGMRVGNDFVLDDLSLTVDCPETEDEVNVNVTNSTQAAIASGTVDISNGYDPPVTLSMTSQNEVCYKWENGAGVTLYATNSSGNTWYIDNVQVYDYYYSPAIGHVRILNNSQTLTHVPTPTTANRTYKISYNNGTCSVDGPTVNARFVATFYPDWNWLGFIMKNSWHNISSFDYGPTATYTWSFPGATVNPASSNSPNAQLFVPLSYPLVYSYNCHCYPVYGTVTISNSPYPCANGTYGVYLSLPDGVRINPGLDTLVGIDKLSPGIYPNPTRGRAQLVTDIPLADLRSVSVYTSGGKNVKNFNYRVRAAVIELDLSGIQSGVYFIVVKTSREMRNYKLVIAK